MADENFFTRLTRLFRSNASMQRYVKQSTYQLNTGVAGQIQQTYKTFGRAFGAEAKTSPIGPRSDISLNRAGRYAVFETMDLVTPEISQALNIYADEIAGADDRGRSFHIYCEKPEIRKALIELFYEIMDIENNIRAWVRSYVKYGEFMLYHEVVPHEGIVSFIPLPINGIDRLEGLDPNDPFAVQFKSNLGTSAVYENWQVTHFRLLSNQLFYPYGTSILDPVRRTWDQLTMAEDSMLTYRVVRSPEKKQILVEVGNAAAADIPSYMEEIKSRYRSLGQVDSATGRMSYRFNPNSIEQDIFIPSRNGVPLLKIEALPAAVNSTQVEDIAYLQGKLFAGLGVPKPYLNYDDNLSSKATLAQADIRFSRTISALQKEWIAQFEKIAAIHLYAKGFVGEDLTAFKFRFSNPSSVAVQQRLALWSTKFDIVQKAKESEVVDELWIQKNILELGDEEVAAIIRGKRADKLRAADLESLQVQDGTKDAQVSDNFDGETYDVPDSGNRGGEQVVDGQQAKGGLPVNPSNAQGAAKKKPTDGGFTFGNDKVSNGLPVKPNPYIAREKHNARRRVTPGTGTRDTSMPDFARMVSGTDKYTRDPFGTKNEFNSSIAPITFENTNLDRDNDYILRSEIANCFSKFDKNKGISRTIDGRIILTEKKDDDREVDLVIEEKPLFDVGKR